MLDAITNIVFKPARWRVNRMLEAYKAVAAEVGKFEERIKQLDDEALKAKTAEFKEAIKAGTKPEDILAEAFAVVREAAVRNVEMRHFDVQLVGGKVLYEGKWSSFSRSLWSINSQEKKLRGK